MAGPQGRTRNNNNGRSRGPGVSGDPRAHQHARRSAAGDASPRAGHLFRPDGGINRQPAARSLQIVRYQGPFLHPHRQWPRRLGIGLEQCAVARRQGAGAGKRPLRHRLGQRRGRDGGRGRGAQGRLAALDTTCGSRSAAAARHGSSDQGDPCGAGRHRVGRLQRYRGDRQGDQGHRSSGAVHGGCGGFARLHAVRNWTNGASTSPCPARKRG
jgi:hypothetical protein